MRNYLVITLLLLTSMNTLKSQELPTIGEVFDFQVGDEFHNISSYGWWGIPMYLSTNKVIDVDYVLDSSEVNYTIINTLYSTGWDDQNFTYLSGPDTLYRIYTNLDSSMYYYDELFEHDTLTYVNDNLCFTHIYGAAYQPSGPWLNYTIVEYAIGLGRTYYSNSSDTGTNSTMLVYYSKGGIECGSLIDISLGIDVSSDPNGISVYPTLFTDFISIESDNKDDLTIQVYSLSGHEILTKRLTSSSFQLDLSFVRSGSYIYVIRNAKDNQVIKTGKIIKG